MLTAKEMEEIRKKDDQKIERIKGKAEEIASSKVSAILEKAQGLKNQVQELVDRKNNLFASPASKAETIARAKKELKEQREKLFFEDLLVQQLKNCQNQHNVFLNQDLMRHFWEKNGWRFVYWIISESDIDRAAEMIPDIGISEAEKHAQIKKIDDEIATLESQLEKELKKV
jgi:hypothetical protein